jgi:hypothetical protein
MNCKLQSLKPYKQRIRNVKAEYELVSEAGLNGVLSHQSHKYRSKTSQSKIKLATWHRAPRAKQRPIGEAKDK